jgi:hypothetical protein
MKINSIKVLSALLLTASILLLAAITSCKKNTLPANESNVLNAQTEKIKVWFEALPTSVAEGQRGTAASRRNMPPAALQWDKANYFAGEHAYVVPAVIKPGNNSASAYLVITADAQSNPQQAGYTIVVPDKKQMSAAQINGINVVPGFLQGKQVPAAFTGALLQYSSDGYGYDNACYAAGGQAKTGHAGGLVAKKATAANAAADRVACGGETVCTDWYYQTWVNGILINEEYLFTTCACDGGAGGGGGGGVGIEDEINPLITQFNNYIKQSTTPVTTYAPITEDGLDPISYTKTWTVTKGAVAPWHVDAIVQMDYYHKTMYNLQLNSLEHVYDIVYYHTLSTDYIGSNTFITTTWNPNLPVDQVYNNNSMYARGVTNITGTLHHVANFQIANPLGGNPITLDVTDAVTGRCTVYPK